MSATVICYPPSGGGNHYKNLLCLDTSFANSSDLDVNVYQPGEPEVQSIKQRNVQESIVDRAVNSNDNYIIHGHFGELAQHRDKIRSIANKKFILFTIGTDIDQQLLSNRQMRLGQQPGHPWYVAEEQPFLYSVEMIQRYFDADPTQIMTVSIHDLWHPTFSVSKIIERLNSFLNSVVDLNKAQELHTIWYNNNFTFDFCHFERTLYGKTSD